MFLILIYASKKITPGFNLNLKSKEMLMKLKVRKSSNKKFQLSILSCLGSLGLAALVQVKSITMFSHICDLRLLLLISIVAWTVLLGMIYVIMVFMFSD